MFNLSLDCNSKRGSLKIDPGGEGEKLKTKLQEGWPLEIRPKSLFPWNQDDISPSASSYFTTGHYTESTPSSRMDRLRVPHFHHIVAKFPPC
ncbi:hypothetical protein EYC84_001031 [Monilinia fructicola]|uniref:Uncharacterized protein n=1 Tax=Monilinia fructicola TaxID=38448 RepID=A0A5M9JNQ5_MONFR|nr:hypothetical protein EYC84_001031 [Monilinia fructicola]